MLRMLSTTCGKRKHTQEAYPRLYMIICFTLIASLLIIITDTGSIVSQDHFAVALKQQMQIDQRSSSLDASQCNYFLMRLCW